VPPNLQGVKIFGQQGFAQKIGDGLKSRRVEIGPVKISGRFPWFRRGDAGCEPNNYC